MGGVKHERFVLPQLLAGLRKSGVDVFCRETFPNQVRHWPDWIEDEAKKAAITGIVDSAERTKAGPRPELHRQREITRLRTGSDELAVSWETSSTAVHRGEDAATIFDLYAAISAKWNGQEVLEVRMGGDGRAEGARWQVIAVKKFQPGAWGQLITRMNLHED